MNVLIVDDHPTFRSGLRAVLRTGGLTVAGEARCVAEALELSRALRPDVVIMDLHLPDGSGVDAIRELAADPGHAPRILALTMSQDEELVAAVLRAGARGYLLKDAEMEEILGAVRTVAAGGAVLGPAVATGLAALVGGAPDAAASPVPARRLPADLTERELDVLRLLAQCLGNRQIARRLGVEETTVRNHLSRVYAKLGVSSRTEAALVARDAGLGAEDAPAAPPDLM